MREGRECASRLGKRAGSGHTMWQMGCTSIGLGGSSSAGGASPVASMFDWILARRALDGTLGWGSPHARSVLEQIAWIVAGRQIGSRAGCDTIEGARGRTHTVVFRVVFPNEFVTFAVRALSMTVPIRH